MHKIYIDGEEITLNTKEYRIKMLDLKLSKEVGKVKIYINPNIVTDEEYIYLLSLKDSNIDKIKEIGNRFEIDEYFKILDLLNVLKDYK